MPSNITRRRFIETTSLGTAGALASTDTTLATGFPKNETLRIGVIGCGGRATYSLMPKAASLPNTKIVALCDVYKAHLRRAKKRLGDQSKDVQLETGKHEELLALKNLDAVIIATPDHWHVPLSIAACQAGKDVYVEKPLTHDLAEGKALISAQNKHRRVLQVGTQQRSMPQFEKVKKLIDEGKIGKVHKVHMSWNRNFLPFRGKGQRNINVSEFDWKRFLGNAPDQKFDPYKAIGSWRWFWDFGAGILGDLMVHWLDAVNWILKLGLPSNAVTIGDHFATQGVWETPDTIQTLMQYSKEKLQIHFEGTFVNQHEKAGVTFMGTEGSIYADRGRFELYPEPRSKFKTEQFIPGKNVKGADFDLDGTLLHIKNWVECIHTREKPIAPAEAGVMASDAAHIANKALKSS